MGNNIARQRLESFGLGHLSHLKERLSIRKGRISNFQNSQKIPEREKLSHFKV